jgi:hydroxyacylglutathione hydrolase
VTDFYGASNVLARPTIEPVASDVWVVRGGMDYGTIAVQSMRRTLPRRAFNVYLLRDGDGVTMFDAGIEAMAEPLRVLCERMGGLGRIVLGHAHSDHRGSAPKLGAPVWTHEDAKQEAETAGDPPYADYSTFDSPVLKFAYKRFSKIWDGGPVKVDRTFKEGDDICGFEVKLFDGHAPGQVGLWRESDGLCLCSDTVYTSDYNGRFGPPRVPGPAFTMDREQALRSIAKLAALAPKEVWAGHADPVVGPDVVEQLERAARG